MAITTIFNRSTSDQKLLDRVNQWLANTVKMLLPAVLGMLTFLILWSLAAQNIDTSLGKFPGPSVVTAQFGALYTEHVEEREKAQLFYQRQVQRNELRLVKDPNYQSKIRLYTGKKTILDQVATSLITVLSGFFAAVIIAIPLGLLLGLNRNLNRAINPLMQIFKPVSPLAWLPLVTMVVSAVYVSKDPMLDKAFLNSMITVTLCSLWPMVINTSMGVASVESDLMNVSKVLRLSMLTHIRKIVVPAAIPLIFTGMRLSLGVAWMVLIAAEMLAQNPGLGKFVWDEFQNGSSASLARIMCAVFIIGFIGYLLDQAMLLVQRLVAWDKSSVNQ